VSPGETQTVSPVSGYTPWQVHRYALLYAQALANGSRRRHSVKRIPVANGWGWQITDTGTPLAPSTRRWLKTPDSLD